VIPAAPLEDHIVRLVEFLHDEPDHDRVRVAAGDDAVHRHRLRVVGHEKRMPVGQDREFMHVGGVAVAHRDRVDHGVTAVHDDELIRALEIGGQSSARLHLEVGRDEASGCTDS
jgi:hypothetical protein